MAGYICGVDYDSTGQFIAQVRYRENDGPWQTVGRSHVFARLGQNVTMSTAVYSPTAGGLAAGARVQRHGSTWIQTVPNGLAEDKLGELPSVQEAINGGW